MIIPEDVKFILDKFHNNSYEAFIVGGCVRDTLLGRPLNDYDITTNAMPEETIKLFKKTIPTGIKHGTITVLINKEPYEVTTYRIDGEYLDNRRPEEVIFVSNIKEDLARRDFTINALAYSPYLGFKDYFNGEEDLKNKIIRAVGDADKRFNEDALRMIRAIRFSAQLDFKIEEKTYNAIKKNSELIKNISIERINVELTKTLLSKNPSRGILLLEDTRILENLFFEDHNKYFSKEYFRGNIITLDKSTNSLALRLSFLISTYFKDISDSDFRKILRQLRFDNKIISNCFNLYSNLNSYLSINSNKELKKLISSIGSDLIFILFEYALLLPNLKNEDIEKIHELISETKRILNDKEPISTKDLAISGSDIIAEFKIKPGKELGTIINYLVDKVLENPKLNNRADLFNIIENDFILIM